MSAGAFLALIAPARAADWSAPTVLSGSDVVSDEAVAIGRDGTSAVAWSRFVDPFHSEIKVRVRPPGGSWLPTQTLSIAADGQNQEPSVAIDGVGNVLVAWTAQERANPGYTGIRVAFAPAGRPFTAPDLIAIDRSGSGRMEPEVFVDRHGDALAVWRTQFDGIRYASRPRGGSFGAEKVAPGTAGSGFVEDLQIAAGAGGDAVLAWYVRPTTFAAVRRPGGDFGAPQVLVREATEPMAAVGDDGTIVVTWNRFGPSSWAAISPPGVSTFAPPELLAEGAYLTFPAVSAEGEIGAIGIGGTVEPFNSGPWAMTRRGSGWTAPEFMGDAERHSTDWPAVTYDSQRSLHVVWRSYLSVDAADTRAAVYVSSRSATGRFPAAPVTLAEHGDIVSRPLLAAGDGARLLAVWRVGSFGMGPLLVAGRGWSSPSASGAGGTAPEGAPATSARGASPPGAGAVQRCVVPRLRGLTVRAARRRLRGRHCTLGLVRGAEREQGRRRRVIAQRPRANASRRAGAAVTVRVRAAGR